MGKNTENNSLLVIDTAYLTRAGIELSNDKNAPAKARAALIEASHGKGYIPQNPASDTVVQIMNYAREEIENGESAMKHVSIALASVDMSGEYRNAKDKNGNEYSSMLAFAQDVLPDLAKSTVYNYIAVGKAIYVPAIKKRFGKSSDILLALPPTTLDGIKGNLNDADLCGDTIAAIQAAAKSGHVTQRLAKAISRTIRDAKANNTLASVNASTIVKAAKGDTNALKLVYPETGAPNTNPGGATKNGGNAKPENHNSPEYDAALAAVKLYVSPVTVNDTHEGITTKNTVVSMTEKDVQGLSGLLKRALVSDNPNDARSIIRALMETICK